MPTNVEIRPQEMFRSLESWKSWFMTILLLMVLAAVSTDVDASDAESMYRENQTLTLTVENVAAFYDSIENVNGDVEAAPINPEVDTDVESYQVVIESDVNVRTLDSSAAILRNFPRGTADVVGWFAATEDDNFGSVQRGYWLVVDNGGQLGAVFTGAVSEVNGSMLTPRELADSNLPQFTFEMGVPTPPAPAEPEVEPSPTGDGPDGDDEEGVEVAMAPEGLVAPEVPNSFTVRTSEYSASTNSMIWVENTVTPTEDIMPLPFGVVDFNQYQQFGNFANLIEDTFRFGSATEMVDFRAMGIHAIFVKASSDGSGGWIYHFAIPREGQSQDQWATFETNSLPGSLAILPVNETLQPVNDPNNLLVVDPDTRLGQNRLEVAANPVVPGDSLIVFVYDSQNDTGPAAEALGRVCNGRNTEEQVELILDGGVCTTLTGFDVNPSFTIGGIASPEN